MTRRDFLKSTAALAGGAFLAGCGLGSNNEAPGFIPEDELKKLIAQEKWIDFTFAAAKNYLPRVDFRQLAEADPAQTALVQQIARDSASYLPAGADLPQSLSQLMNQVDSNGQPFAPLTTPAKALLPNEVIEYVAESFDQTIPGYPGRYGYLEAVYREKGLPKMTIHQNLDFFSPTRQDKISLAWGMFTLRHEWDHADLLATVFGQYFKLSGQSGLPRVLFDYAYLFQHGLAEAYSFWQTANLMWAMACCYPGFYQSLPPGFAELGPDRLSIMGDQRQIDPVLRPEESWAGKKWGELISTKYSA